MKVLHIIGSINASAGGPSRSVPQTCEYLAKQGVDVTLIARPGEDAVHVNTSENFKLYFKSIKELWEYGKNIKKEDFDLIHLQHIWDPYIHVMARVARKKGIPYIITPRGMLEPWIMNQNPLKKRLGMLLYQRKDIIKANAVHATGELERGNIKNLGFENKIYIIPNGIKKIDSSKIIADSKNKKIIFLSRIHEKKGIEVLLDAWKNLKNNQFILEIAGEGDEIYLESLKQKIKKEKIEKVWFVGAKYGEEKWKFIKSGKIFVLPTYSENFGIVVAEALAVGIPVITTKETPWNELQSENCGWWIDLGIEPLVNAINDAMSKTPEELEEMGKNGSALIEKKYIVEKIASQMLELYKSILKNG